MIGNTIIVDVDDVLLHWALGFREFHSINQNDYDKPFYGLDKDVFYKAVYDFNQSVEFGELSPTSIFFDLSDYMKTDKELNIIFLSSCGDSDEIYQRRLSNMQRWFEHDSSEWDSRCTLVCLPLHGSKKEFFESVKDCAIMVVDDAWCNCVDSDSVGIPTFQMIPRERDLALWEREWYHIGEANSNIKTIWR